MVHDCYPSRRRWEAKDSGDIPKPGAQVSQPRAEIYGI